MLRKVKGADKEKVSTENHQKKIKKAFKFFSSGDFSRVSDILEIGTPSVTAGQLEIYSEIGQGEFATVYTANWQGKTVACKELRTARVRDKDDVGCMLNEIYFMAQFTKENAPYIVKFEGWGIFRSHFVIITEYFPLGDLSHLIEWGCPKLKDTLVRYTIIQNITESLVWLHGKNIIHGDIKPDNILINGKCEAKLADFGLTNFENSGLKGRGTPFWAAPELFRDKKNTKQSDMFSWGVSMWEINLFSPIQNAYAAIDIKTLPRLQDFLSTRRVFTPARRNSLKWNMLISSCWDNDKKTRLTAEQLKSWLVLEPNEIIKKNLKIMEINREIIEKDKIKPYIPFLLSHVCKHGFLEWVKKVIVNYPDCNELSQEGYTPFYLACAEGHLEIAKFLIEHGVDIQKKSLDGETPLFGACARGKLQMVEFLSDKIDVNEPDKNGVTPLMIASFQGYLHVVKKLISHKADFYHKANNGMTAFFAAVQNGKYFVMQTLMDQGAGQLTDKNPNGETPLDIAFANNYMIMTGELMFLSTKSDLLSKPIMSLKTVETAKTWNGFFPQACYDYSFFEKIQAANYLQMFKTFLEEKKEYSSSFFKLFNAVDDKKFGCYQNALAQTHSPIEQLMLLNQFLGETGRCKLPAILAKEMGFEEVGYARLFISQFIDRQEHEMSISM